MIDSQQQESEAITTSLEKQGKDYRLKVTADQGWLSDPKRAFPVTVDPTITMGPITVTGKQLVYYIPSIDYLGGNSSIIPPLTSSNTYGNTQNSILWKNLIPGVYGLPYDTQISYKATISSGTGSMRIIDWNPEPNSDTDSTSTILGYFLAKTSVGSSKTGSFILPKQKAAKFELNTPSTSAKCGFTITFQKETMSPLPPVIQSLPPETYSTTATLTWSPAVDDWNQDDWNQSPWNQATSIPTFQSGFGSTPSGNLSYIVQYSTDSTFASNVVSTTITGGQTTVSITGLSYGNTYYFRVCAQDDDGNPINMSNPWSSTNLSGPRWSAITATTCLQGVLPSYNPPVINQINPSNFIQTDNCYYSVNRNPVISWTNPSNWPASTPTISPITMADLVFTMIASGGSHSIGLKSDGTVWTWGDNECGQLGDGTTTQRNDPVRVMMDSTTPLDNVIAIAGGLNHTIALKNDGTVWTWGDNGYGQLGSATMIQHNNPVQVMMDSTTPLNNVIAIAGGLNYTIALKNDGTVWAWGWDCGLLENGRITNCGNPIQVMINNTTPLTNIIAIAGGFAHTIALKNDGTVWTWGDNSFGDLGDGTTTWRNNPVQVKVNSTTPLTNVIAIAGGCYHTIILKNDGTVWTWGDNGYGQLGDGTTTNRSNPVQVMVNSTTPLTNVKAIAGGYYSTIALRNDNTVWAWGDNCFGKLGDGTTTQRNNPVQVMVNGSTPLTNVSCIAGGTRHTIALKNDGSVWAWGYNYNGQLGNGTTVDRWNPVHGKSVAMVATGELGYHNVQLKSDGTVWAWGLNTYGELGDGTTTQRNNPIQVMINSTTPLTNVVAIAGEKYHTIALKSDGTVWTWGDNEYGQLGDGTKTNRSNPVQVMINSTTPLTNVTAIAGGCYHTIALKNDGTVWAWGINVDGELGDGTTTQRNNPVQVKLNSTTPLSNVIAIAGGGFHTITLKNDGTVWAWGYNRYGELGDGTITNRSNPIQVKLNSTIPLSNVIAIAGGYYHTIALKNDGTVWTWGSNEYGQLGDDTNTTRPNPVQVMMNGSTPLTNVIVIAAGCYHTFALKNDGTVWAWGYNYYSQLGNGTFARNNPNPIQVMMNSTTSLTNVVAIAGGVEHTIALKSDGTVWAWGTYHVYQDGSHDDGGIPYPNQPYPTATIQNPTQIIIMQYNQTQTATYPIIYADYSQTSAQTNWNLPDGQYVVDVGITTNDSAWLWSVGKLITIDTTPPSISAITPMINGQDVKLKFTSSEPVSAVVYWDMSNIPLPLSTDYKSYDGTDNTALDLGSVYSDPAKPHYFQIVFQDKALNTYSTQAIQLTIGGPGGDGNAPGTTIVNSDRNFGLESYWNYQSISLGRAGTANVNLNNGNLVVAATDFNIPGRGIPLAMGRYYNSLLDYQGMLGKGWRTSYEIFLDIGGQNVTINEPDGSTHLFTYVSDTKFSRPKGDFRTVVCNAADGSYTVTETNGAKYNFGPPQNNRCRLNSIVDRFGNILTLNYDITTGYLTSVTEPSGRITALFEYNFVDPATGQKLLTGIRFTPVDPGATQSRYITYLYQDGKGRLTDVRYPTDQMEGGQIVEAAVNYTYDSNFGLLSSSKVYLRDGNTELTGSRRNDTVFGYKPTRRSIGAVSTYYSYDGNTRNAVNYYFDYNGNSTVLTDPKGNQYTFNHYGSDDSDGNNGQLKSVTMPSCMKADGTSAIPISTISYTYNSDYNLKTVTQPKNVYDLISDSETLRNVVTTYNFDSDTGNLNSLTLDTGYQNATTSFTYEADTYHTGVINDIKTITDAKGNVMTYTNTYDSIGKLANITITPPVTDPADPYTITHTFDQYGQRTDKDVKVNGVSKYHFSYGYLNGLLSTLTNAFGSTTYYYTLYGERSGILDANNVKTQNSIGMYTGNLLAQNAPVEVSFSMQFQSYCLSADSNRVRYSYDVNGNAASKADAFNNVTTNFYDELNQLIRVQSPYVSGLTQYNSYYQYDANGNLTDVTDYNQLRTTTVYDAANRKIQIKDNAGDIQQEIEYDESNRVKVLWDGKKTNHTVNYYDSLDNLLCAKYYDDSNTLAYTINYTYDPNGNMSKKSAPLSAKSGGETGIINTDYTYDTLNRVVSVNVSCDTNNKYNQTTSYAYEAGQLKTMTVTGASGAPQTYTYCYDPAMRLEYLTNQAGQEVKFDYYAGGQRKTKYLYKQSTDADPFMTVTYDYDSAYLLRQLNYGWGRLLCEDGLRL